MGLGPSCLDFRITGGTKMQTGHIEKEDDMIFSQMCLDSGPFFELRKFWAFAIHISQIFCPLKVLLHDLSR